MTLDTNVLGPGLIGETGAAARLTRLWSDGAFVLVVSDHILAELERSYTDPYFAARVPSERAAALVNVVRNDATVVELSAEVQGVATHPEDDLVLATAISGEASVLCTRDKQLLKLRTFEGIEILSPGEFLDRIAGE
ncbi:MAG: putative toxin-antitoxin system toxin component, PIN family [Thermomicrobiales bacterium]